MTKKQVLHLLGLVATAALGVLVDYLSKSHYVWGPVVVALAVNLRTALGGVPPGPAASALAIGAAKLAARSVVTLFALALLTASGCKSLGPTPPPGTPGFVDCSEAALHTAALGILPSVENALASPSYEAALASIIASVGGPLALAEVECAVAWVATKADERAQATGDQLEATKEVNGRAWLAAHQVNFTPTGAP